MKFSISITTGRGEEVQDRGGKYRVKVYVQMENKNTTLTLVQRY